MQESKQTKAVEQNQHTAPRGPALAGATENGLVDNRAASADLRQLAIAIDASPRMLAQRKQAESISGPTVQRAGTDLSLQRKAESATPAAPNRTGLPDNLKSGIESLSGMSMDHVKVHYNSPQPAQLNALAYAQGSDIHVAPGQEQHVPHEAWHVVQQAQGRVQPTTQMKAVDVNDNPGLEHEADVMGAKAMQHRGDPSAALQRQAAHGNANSNANGSAADGAGAPALQRKTMAGLSSGQSAAGANDVYFSNGAQSVARYWEMPVVDSLTRPALIQSLAAAAGRLGNEIDAKVAAPGWNAARADAERPGVAAFDPIRVRFRGQYGAAPPPPKATMALDYHFGNKWSGYVIHVVDSGQAIDQEMHDPDAVAALDVATEYSDRHETVPGRLEQEDTADAVTKLAGEGARWNCIADHVSTVRDTSKIYTNENADTPVTRTVRYVNFRTLWKSWAATFDKAYRISDATVADKLTAANIHLSSGDQAVSTANSNTMVHGTDIAVDDTKPTQQTDLNPVTVKFLYFKKPTSVAGSANTLAVETTTVKAAADAVAGIVTQNVGGYVGKNTFAFLSTTTAHADPTTIAGYQAVPASQVDLSYPYYRRTKLEGLARSHASGVAIGAGDATYETEKRAAYDASVKKFVDEIDEYDVPGADEIDVDAFVRETLIPWDDVDTALPLLWDDDARYADDGTPTAYYEAEIATYSAAAAAAAAAARQAEIDRRVAVRLAALPGYVASGPREKTRIRSGVVAAVTAEVDAE